VCPPVPDLQPSDLSRSSDTESATGGRRGGRPLPRPGIDPARELAVNATTMFAVARRVSICDDDAHDAVQAAAERFLKHLDRVDPETVGGWLCTVVRNEALRVRERRVRAGEIDEETERVLADRGDGPDDLVVREEELALAREALGRLKPHERLALWMQAEGRSYDEIAEELSWTRTKVNRSITEGRASLRRTLTGIATGEGCAVAGPRIDRLAGGGASAEDLRELRPHLRRCTACRARLRRARGGRWGVLPPIVVAWVPWAGRGGGAPTPARARIGEFLAERLAIVLPASTGAVSEVGIAVTTGLAVAALGAGVVAGGSSSDDRESERDRRSGRVEVAAPTVRRTIVPTGPLTPAASFAPAARATDPVSVARTVTQRVAAADEQRATAARDARRRREARARRKARARKALRAQRLAAERRRRALSTANRAAPAPAPRTPAPTTSGTGGGSGGSTSGASGAGSSSSGGGSSSSGGGSSSGGRAASEFGFE
jgi:RNA polymerase sigma factor (sigma-70 family)